MHLELLKQVVHRQKHLVHLVTGHKQERSVVLGFELVDLDEGPDAVVLFALVLSFLDQIALFEPFEHLVGEDKPLVVDQFLVLLVNRNLNRVL